jgi:hypothetical protein
MRGFASIRFIAAILLGLALTACDSGGGGGSSTHTYLGTQSPGDVWNITISGGSFEATNVTTTYTYSGTKTTLANGFLKLVVTASTEPGVPLDGTAIAYAMEVPGVAVLLKPGGADSKIIAGVSTGACPTESASYNYVQMPPPGWNAISNEAYGRADLTVSGSDIAIAANNRFLDGTSAGPTNNLTGTCSDGEMTFSNDPEHRAAITPAGVVVQDNGPGAGGIVGVQAPSVGVTAANLAAAGREFRGVLFKNDDATEEDTQAVWVRTDVGGSSLIGGMYTDFEGNVEDAASTATIDNLNEPTPGQFNATLDTPGGPPGSFVLMVNEIGGKYMIFGIGENDDGLGGAFNVLLMEL